MPVIGIPGYHQRIADALAERAEQRAHGGEVFESRRGVQVTQGGQGPDTETGGGYESASSHVVGETLERQHTTTTTLWVVAMQILWTLICCTLLTILFVHMYYSFQSNGSPAQH